MNIDDFDCLSWLTEEEMEELFHFEQAFEQASKHSEEGNENEKDI